MFAARLEVDVHELAAGVAFHGGEHVEVRDEGVLLADLPRPLAAGLGDGVVGHRLGVAGDLDRVALPVHHRAGAVVGALAAGLDVEHEHRVGRDLAHLATGQGEAQRDGGAGDAVEGAGEPPCVVDARGFDGEDLQAVGSEHRAPSGHEGALHVGVDAEHFAGFDAGEPVAAVVGVFGESVAVGAAFGGDVGLGRLLGLHDDRVGEGLVLVGVDVEADELAAQCCELRVGGDAEHHPALAPLDEVGGVLDLLAAVRRGAVREALDLALAWARLHGGSGRVGDVGHVGGGAHEAAAAALDAGGGLRVCCLGHQPTSSLSSSAWRSTARRA